MKILTLFGNQFQHHKPSGKYFFHQENLLQRTRLKHKKKLQKQAESTKKGETK